MKLFKKNDTFMIAASLFVIILLVLSGLYYGFSYFEEDTKPMEKPPEVTIDDRISPLTNQGLIFEIQRIRHRGLLEEIMKMGTSWKQKPSFYFITDIDGVEYVSKDVHAASGSNEQLFNTWDTILQENKVMSDATEEQEKADITLTIVEREKTGILGLRTSDVEKEQIQITYDYRTGRWTGDDYFIDNDGYGHYLGENFEIWFDVYPTDYDHDGIPYWTEVNVINTNPRVSDDEIDTDGDGCTNAWEWKWGYDPHSWDDHKYLDPDLDGIENIEEEMMDKWFGDPFSQDIYIEIDGMEKGGFNDPAHIAWEESQQVMIERFAQHGYNVYFDDGWPSGPVNGGGELLPHIDVISQSSGMMNQFYTHHFADERKGIFRYFVVGHVTGFCHPSEFNKYDTLSIGTAKEVMNSLVRKAFTPRLKRLSLASLIMHEGGHSLGIAPWTIGGCDNLNHTEGREAKNEYISTWGNYESVMNYLYVYDYSLVDYSSGDDAEYDQNDWESLYLPTFQTEATVIESPDFQIPGTDNIVLSNTTPSIEGWTYDENITSKNKGRIQDIYVLENVGADVRCYVKEHQDESNENLSNVKVFAKPLTGSTYSEYILVAEGKIDHTDREIIQFYSQEQIIDELRMNP